MKRRAQKMMGMTCEDVEGFILDYLDGALRWRTRAMFRMHILFCKECRVYIRKYEVARELGQQVMRGEPESDEAEIPEDLITAILAARADEEPDPSLE